jgi:TonB family protein
MAQAVTSPQDQLKHEESATSLDDAPMAPWHMKMEVQLYDLLGAAKEKGTIEEWWSGPKSYKIVYDTPSYAATQLRSADGFFISSGKALEPFLLGFAKGQVVHPMLRAVDPADEDVSMTPRTLGSLKLACLVVRRKDAKGKPSTAIPRTYCTLPGKDDLLVSEDFETEVASRTKTGRFRDRAVALDVTVKLGERSAVSGHVVELQGQTAPYTDALSASGLVKQRDDRDPDGVLKPGKIVSTVQPVYPMSAKMRGTSGSVVLAVVIDTSGGVKSLEVLASPAEDLTNAALDSVRQWRYEPYLVNGEPVEVNTTVTVRFHLGSMMM